MNIDGENNEHFLSILLFYILGRSTMVTLCDENFWVPWNGRYDIHVAQLWW